MKYDHVQLGESADELISVQCTSTIIRRVKTAFCQEAETRARVEGRTFICVTLRTQAHDRTRYSFTYVTHSARATEHIDPYS